MSNKILSKVFKFTGMGLIFVAPIVYLIWKYNRSTTQVVEVTTNSMPLIIIGLLSVVIVVFISFVFSNVKALIKEHPFGYESTYFYGALIGGLLFIAVMFIDKVIDLINANTAQFITDLTLYKHSAWVMIAYILVGLLMSASGQIIEKLA